LLKIIMIKTVAFAGLLAASCVANAATSTWTFAFTGFFNDQMGAFDRDYKLSGSFTGGDTNGDGVIGREEISSFFINGTNYLNCGGGEYYQCGTDSFTYRIGGALNFIAGASGSDPEGYAGGIHYFQTGDREWEYHYTPVSVSETSHRWTDETAFTISSGIMSGADVPAVPEPGTWAMLASGLLLVSAAGARARRNGALRADA
jgi:hypothetical protein